jgi:DNA-binding IclR family transcriptional regulator
MNAGTSGRIGSVERFSAVVDALRENGAMTSQAVADELDIAKSTAHAYLATMEDLEFVVHGTDGYALGLRLLDHGMYARDRIPVVGTAAEAVEQLANDTAEAVYLVVEEHGKAVYVDYALGDRAVKTHARIGTRSHLHSLASGKAILAHLSEDRVWEIVDDFGLPAKTENTISSPEELFEELASVRERGYAVNEHEAMVGTRAVATPILPGDDVVGAIAVAGPANRLTRDRLEDGVLGEVLATANEIELILD